MTARYLLSGQLSFMRDKGLEVTLVTSPGKDLDITEERERITVVPIEMEREIHPVRDLIALIRLIGVMKRRKPDIVNASTPKAGFLGMLAAWIVRVPVRIYVLRGLRLETKKGIARSVLKMTERIASGCAHRVICVSNSLKEAYTSLRLAKESKIKVFGKGSSNGVDVKHFQMKDDSEDSLRALLKIPPDAPVVGFVGRLTHDKGVKELVNAYDSLLSSFPNAHLLILGEHEQADAVDAEFIAKLKRFPHVITTGFVDDPAPYYQIMNVLAFPSYREGFPNAPLEAASCGIPAVGFSVTGTKDAIEDGVTGKLVLLHDADAFAQAIRAYFQDPQLQKAHGNAARQRVLTHFAQQKIWESLYQEYVERLSDRNPK